MRPKNGKLKVGDVELRYQIAGAGPVLVVQAPGWGIGAGPYEATFAPLRERFTLVTYDPRGSGGSTIDAPDLDVGRQVEDLEALRRHLSLDRFAVIGHSHGGLIAIHYAMKYPQRVTALIALDAQLIGVPSDEDPRPMVREMLEDPVFRHAYATLLGRGGFGAIASMTTDREFQTFLADVAAVYFKQTQHAAVLADYIRGHPLSLRTVQTVSHHDGEYPVLPGAKRIRAPTLVVSGTYDVVCPIGAARAFAAAVPGAELAEFRRSGHFPWLEEPEAFYEKVAGFLAARQEAPIAAKT